MLLLVQILNWLLWGASFAALTFALGAYTPAQLWRLTPHLIAVYPIAYAIGLISFITPSGFGVLGRRPSRRTTDGFEQSRKKTLDSSRRQC